MASALKRLAAPQFLNVDLDIYSKRDLQPIAKRLGRKVFTLYIGRDRGRYSAHFELAGETRAPDSTIRALCRVIESLPTEERALWDSATVKSFSIGIQAGTKQGPTDFVIRPATVKAVSELGAQIVLTLY